MSYIAIDLGNKHVGIAISRENIAFSHIIVNRTELVPYLKKYFKQDSEITHIIVGLPYDLYGQDMRQLEKTKKFIKKLQITFLEKKIIGHDERFSSFEANEVSGGHRDDIAAQCILQSYLDSKK